MTKESAIEVAFLLVVVRVDKTEPNRAVRATANWKPMYLHVLRAKKLSHIDSVPLRARKNTPSTASPDASRNTPTVVYSATESSTAIVHWEVVVQHVHAG